MIVTFELYGIVKSKGKKIAVGDNGVFSTGNEKIISKLRQLGFKEIEPNKESPGQLSEPGTAASNKVPGQTRELPKEDIPPEVRTPKNRKSGNKKKKKA
jgi:hypothetical protein